MKRSFAPNVIHSIDATIVRILVTEFYKTHNIILEPLYDCFRVHPNFADVLDKDIKNL